MPDKEKADKIIALLKSNLEVAQASILKREDDDPRPLDTIEMATRTVSRNERIPELRANSEFRARVIDEVMPIAMQYDSINNNANEMLKAVRYSSRALQYASDRLKNDPTFMVEVAKVSPQAIEQSEELIDNPNFLLAAIKANSEVSDLEAVKSLKETNPEFAKRVDKVLRQNKEARLSELQQEDTELTNEIENQKAEKGVKESNQTDRTDE